MQIDTRLLTAEQKHEVREWNQLFEATPAWAWLVQQAQEQKEALEKFVLYSARTEGDLREARGQILVLESLINLELIKEAEFNQVADSLALSRDELRDSLGANS